MFRHICMFKHILCFVMYICLNIYTYMLKHICYIMLYMFMFNLRILLLLTGIALPFNISCTTQERKLKLVTLLIGECKVQIAECRETAKVYGEVLCFQICS